MHCKQITIKIILHNNILHNNLVNRLAAALYKTKKKVQYIKSGRDNIESTVSPKKNPVYGVEAEDVNY